MDELERIELRAILDFFAAASPEVANELDLAVLELDEGAAFSIGAEPKPLLFNRVLGLTDHGPPVRARAVEYVERLPARGLGKPCC